MPRENKFYDSQPCSEETESVSVQRSIKTKIKNFNRKKLLQEETASPVQLCVVCGCRGPLSCGKCKSTYYCGAAHQKIDWTFGGHKQNCAQTNNKSIIANPKHKYLFDEYELVIEPEHLDDEKDKETDEEAEERRFKEYEEFLNKQKNKKTDVDLNDVPDKEFNKMTNSIEEDVTFNKFKKRIQKYQDQVVRFNRGENPLWISNKNVLNIEDIPKCEQCQSNRVFEFQVSIC